MTRKTGAGMLLDHKDTVRLAEDFGTPLFVFSQRRLEKNAKGFLKSFIQAGIPHRIFYACKANSNIAILKTIRECDLDIEVNSGGELFKALQAGYHPGRIIFNGVAKSDEELKQAIRCGIYCINVDSISELRAIIALSRQLVAQVFIAIRLIPEIKDGGHTGLETGVSRSKFGIHPSHIAEACKLIAAAGRHVKLIGIHAHVGSQIGSLSSYRQAALQLLLFKDTIERLLPVRIRHLNLGGGLPVEHCRKTASDTEKALCPPKSFASAFSVADLAQALKEVVPPGIELFMEPGRCIVGDTAILLSRVVRKKETSPSGCPWLILDAGFNTLLENFSYHWYFHMVAASRITSPHTARFLVGGPLCDGGDVFPVPGNEDADCHRLLPEYMHEGDIVAFLDTGAYTLEQMTPYNGRPPAMAVMIETSDKVRIIRRRDTYSDLVRNEK